MGEHTDHETDTTIGPTALSGLVDGRQPAQPVLGAGPARCRTLPHVDGLLAGAAEVDITPPPGHAQGRLLGQRPRRQRLPHPPAGPGHPPAGRAGRRWPSCSCDLLGGSSVLQHLVAEAVAERTDIPLAGLWIGATHTHAGPGQFLGTDFYNRYASNRAGFDPAWTQFLVEQIAGAVDRGPRHPGARPGWPSAAPRCGASPATGRTTRTSRTRTVTDKRLDPQRKWVAVNPLLHLLRVDRIVDDGGTEPLAAAVDLLDPRHRHPAARPRVQRRRLGLPGRRARATRSSARHGARPVVGAIGGHPRRRGARRCAPAWPATSRPQRIGRASAPRPPTSTTGSARELADELAARRRPPRGRPRPGANRRDRRHRAARPPGRRRRARRRRQREPHAGHPPHPAVPGRPPQALGRQGPARARSGSSARRWLQPLVLPQAGLPAGARRAGAAHRRRRRCVGLPFEITVESGRRIAAAVAGAPWPTAGVDRVDRVVGGQRVLGLRGHRRGVRAGSSTRAATPSTAPTPSAFLAAHAAGWPPTTVGAGVVRRRRPTATLGPRPPSATCPAAADGRRPPSAAFTGTAALHRPHRPRSTATGSSRGSTSAPGGLALARAAGAGRAVRRRRRHLVARARRRRPPGRRPGLGARGHPPRRARRRPPHLPGRAGTTRVHRFGRRHRFVLAANNGRPELAGAAFD